jgi:eukaryotic-like serine/threonine-protein kinase
VTLGFRTNWFESFMQPAVDTFRFLKMVLRSGLLGAEELKTAYRSMPKDQRRSARLVAEQLVKTGKLSRYQAGKLLAGTPKGLLLGSFQILAPIGRGGMATVYLARDSRNDQLVALKVLRAREEERHLARFQREMQICNRVFHPHIARTFEVGVEIGVYYIAMEFIPGQDLSKMVHEHGPLDVARAAQLFAEVAGALQHAHQQGLVHRDVKPSNIRITPHHHAKVLDLGLALIEGEEVTDREVVGGEGYIVGSMDYIAPEQTFDACGVDGRADIYAMGCSLYFTLTGKPPFPGGSSRDKILHHRSDEPALLTERNPGVPPRFAELVHRMMAKDPAKRIASAEAVRRELAAWVPADAEEPLDRLDDTNFRIAVASLREADTSDDLLPIAEAEPRHFAQTQWLFWLAGAFVAMWVLLTLGVMVLLLLK